MGISVLVAATTRNQNTKAADVLSLTRTLGEPSTCELTIFDPAGAIIPVVGNIIEIQDQASDVQFFGSVHEVTKTIENGSTVINSRITATDLNHMTTRRNAGEYEWVDKTVLYIVSDIVSNSLDGDLTDVSLVETGPTIPNFKIDMATVKEAFDALAELAGMRWYIDELNRLNFFTPSVAADAPFAIADGTNVSMVSVRETREDYCNSVSARVGNALRDPDTESFVGDGAKTSFEVAYPIGSAPLVTLNGVENTVGVTGVDTGKDWYWSENSREIRQDSGGLVLTGGDTLAVTYTGIESIIIAVEDAAEIAARGTAEGNSGKYHKHLDIQAITTRADALATIQAYLDRHSELTSVLTVETNEFKEPDILLLRPGQVINFTLAGYGVTGLFLIKSVTLTHIPEAYDQADYQWYCRFEAVKGPVLSNFADMFRQSGSGSTSGTGASTTATSGAGAYVQDVDLVANTTISAAVRATRGATLFVYVTQDSTPRTINFDTADFAPVPNTAIPAAAGAVTCFPFCGRSDGLWWFAGFSSANI